MAEAGEKKPLLQGHKSEPQESVDLGASLIAVPWETLHEEDAERPLTLMEEFQVILVRIRIFLISLFPTVTWLPAYQLSDLKGDLLAGTTVGVMAIPQGMAYAIIAGMDTIYGLYSSTVPILVYAIFGTSRELSYGPFAIVSLLVERGVGPLAESGTEEYNKRVFFLTLIVGAIFVTMGFLRLGFVVNFFARPVMSGFMSASGLIIASEQLKYLIGVSIQRQEKFYWTIYALLLKLPEMQWATFMMAIVCLTSLVVFKKLKQYVKKVPLEGPVILVFGGVLFSWWFDLANQTLGGSKIRLVGDIPRGLPFPSLPVPLPEGRDVQEYVNYIMDLLVELIPVGLAIALVGYMASISVAKKFADLKKYEINPSQELIALGMANFVGSFFSAFPGAGSLSKTMVNATSGANSQLASVFSVSIMVVVLLFFTRVFEMLPYVVLGAIVVMAVIPLFEYDEMINLWRLRKRECFLWITTVLATLIFGIINGIVISVLLSMVLVIYRTSHPHIDVLGRLPGSRIYRNVERFPAALVIPRMTIMRLDAELYFANIGFLKNRLREEEKKNIDKHDEEELARAGQNGKGEAGKEGEQQPLTGVVVLDWSSINDVDYTACMELISVIKEYKARRITLLSAAVKGPVRDTLVSAGIVSLIGKENFYWELHDAVKYGKKLLEESRGKYRHHHKHHRHHRHHHHHHKRSRSTATSTTSSRRRHHHRRQQSQTGAGVDPILDPDTEISQMEGTHLTGNNNDDELRKISYEEDPNFRIRFVSSDEGWQRQDGILIGRATPGTTSPTSRGTTSEKASSSEGESVAGQSRTGTSTTTSPSGTQPTTPNQLRAYAASPSASDHTSPIPPRLRLPTPVTTPRGQSDQSAAPLQSPRSVWAGAATQRLSLVAAGRDNPIPHAPSRDVRLSEDGDMVSSSSDDESSGDDSETDEAPSSMDLSGHDIRFKYSPRIFSTVDVASLAETGPSTSTSTQSKPSAESPTRQMKRTRSRSLDIRHQLALETGKGSRDDLDMIIVTDTTGYATPIFAAPAGLVRSRSVGTGLSRLRAAGVVVEGEEVEGEGAASSTEPGYPTSSDVARHALPPLQHHPSSPSLASILRPTTTTEGSSSTTGGSGSGGDGGRLKERRKRRSSVKFVGIGEEEEKDREKEKEKKDEGLGDAGAGSTSSGKDVEMGISRTRRGEEEDEEGKGKGKEKDGD